MKKNVLMKSKRMAAFALSLSMILSDGSLIGAAEVNANPEAEPAVVSETETTETVDSETTETTETADSETAETTETNTETSEATLPEVTVPETTVPETTVPETEVAAPVADAVDPAADEAAPAAEATETTEETTEEETENADLEEETEELGAYNGTVSKVIGLKGEPSAETFKDANGNVAARYVYVSQPAKIRKQGNLEETGKDPNTGLYNVDGKVFGRADYESDGDYTEFSNEVVASFPVGQVPQADATTGLYIVNGLYYSGLYSGGVTAADGTYTLKCSYVTKENEVVPVGAVANLTTRAAAEQAAGGVNVDGKDDCEYYTVGGKQYTNISDNDTYYYVAANSQISLTHVKPFIEWNGLSNDNVLLNNNKAVKIGYQVKVNDVVEANADTIAADSAEGVMAIRKYTSATLDTLVGPGESAKISVRGIYYVETKTKDAKNQDVTSYTVVAKGDWSETYTFAPETAALKEVPMIGGLTATVSSDSDDVILKWNPVKEALTTRCYVINSKVPLDGILTSETFGKIKQYAGHSLENIPEADKALFGTVNPEDLQVSYYYDSDEDMYVDYKKVSSDSEKVSFERGDEHPYRYFALQTTGAVDGYVNNTSGKYSNIAGVVTPTTVNNPQVQGFKVEKKKDGSYSLVWNPVNAANMVIYVYEQQNLPEFFNVDELKVEKSQKRADGTMTDPVRDWDREFLTNEQKALINKVDAVEVDKYEMKDGEAYVSGLKPGVTYYFTAFTYDEGSVPYTVATSADGTEVYTSDVYFSPASAVASVKYALTKPVVKTKASKDSIKLTLGKGEDVTGYQIYRKNNKNKWKKIATTTDDVYTDADLKENTKYSYRVRSYYYNKDNKKTFYSDYTYKTVSTSQITNIALNVTMKSTSQAKLTWTKVGKAEKYEIYRSNSENVDPKIVSKKYKTGNDFAQELENAKYELVKTVKKAKTTSYTDKKLKSGEKYSYVIIAYFKDGKASRYIHDTAEIAFEVQEPKNVLSENKGTSAKITWNADKFASKFEVKYKIYDKYGNILSDKWTVKSTKKNSYTIKGLESGGYATVAVRAYGKNKTYSGWSGVTTTTSLKVAKDIKAKNVTETLSDGKTKKAAVKISWKKVSGAKYYKVYRSTKTAIYNKDEKKYYYENTQDLIAKESNDTEGYHTDAESQESEFYDGEVAYTEYFGVPGSVVGTSAIDRAQLLDGVTYYYSVVAFGEKDTEIASYVTSMESKFAYATSKPASVVFNKDLKISSIKNSKKGQVAIKYNKVKDAKQYVIYRADKKNGEFKKIGTSKKASYTDKKVKKGKTYYYKVVATGTNKAKANMEVTSSVKKIKVKK